MAAQTTRAVLLDALGTLVALEDPAPPLAAALGVPLDDARRAMRAEIGFYREHLHRGRDAQGLAALRRDCAEIVRRELGLERDVHDELLASLVFTAYDDVAPTLAELRARGLKLIVVSNWDRSLHEALAATGLAGLVDGAISSAEAGSAKPDPAIFAQALALAGTRAAVHVGDTADADVAGARAAGLRAVLIDRDGQAPQTAGVPVIASLAELPALLS